MQEDLFGVPPTSPDPVQKSAEQRWTEAALAAIARCAATRAEFTTDDVWLALAKGGEGHGPRDHRRMGHALLLAKKRQIARPLDAVRPSVSIRAHKRPVRVWVAY